MQPELELQDVLVIKTTEGEKELEFEVVGVMEDDEHKSFAVLYCEAEDEFVVTDVHGNLLQDEEVAQEVLDDFRAFTEEAGDQGETD